MEVFNYSKVIFTGAITLVKIFAVLNLIINIDINYVLPQLATRRYTCVNAYFTWVASMYNKHNLLPTSTTWTRYWA